MFIPVSGWTADRFGARTVFRAAIGVFMLGSIGCALSGSLTQFVAARIVEGMGGAMMTPVARLILVRSVDRRELINAMVWVTLPALVGPLIGPPLGGFITTYISWHWIFLINIPIGLAGIVLATIFIEDVRARDARPVRPRRRGARRRRHRRAGFRRLDARAQFPADRRGRRADRRRRGSRPMPTSGTRGARRRRCSISRCLNIPTMRAAIVGGFVFRSGIGAMPFLLPLPAAARLRPHRVPVRPDHAVERGRRHGHEDGDPDHPAALRLPPRADGERADQRGAGRGLRDVHPGRAVRRGSSACW